MLFYLLTAILNARFDNAAVLLVVLGSLVILGIATAVYSKFFFAKRVIKTQNLAEGGNDRITTVTDQRDTDVELRISDVSSVSNPMARKFGYTY